jgi:hypothetical protein
MVKYSLTALGSNRLELQHFPANFARKGALATKLLTELPRI